MESEMSMISRPKHGFCIILMNIWIKETKAFFNFTLSLKIVLLVLQIITLWLNVKKGLQVYCPGRGIVAPFHVRWFIGCTINCKKKITGEDSYRCGRKKGTCGQMKGTCIKRRKITVPWLSLYTE